MPWAPHVAWAAAALSAFTKSCSAVHPVIQAVPWQPMPDRYRVKVPGDPQGMTVSLYSPSSEVGISTGYTLEQALQDPEDGGRNWYFVELYDHMCPHCWYAKPVVTDVARAFGDVDGLRITSLNCHVRTNAEACFFLEVVTGAVDYPTFVLCPPGKSAPQPLDEKKLPPRAQRLLRHLDRRQKESAASLFRCKLRYEPLQEDQNGGMQFLSATSIAEWLLDHTRLQAAHPEQLTRGADFVDRRPPTPDGPPGQPGWAKDDRENEPGVPAFAPAERWADALHGFVSILYHGYRPERHSVMVESVYFLSRAFPLHGQHLYDLGQAFEKMGKLQTPENVRIGLQQWAKVAQLPDPGQSDPRYLTCDGTSCIMWTLLHVTLTAIAARGITGQPLMGETSLAVDHPAKDFAKPEEAVRFVKNFVGHFLSCGPCKAQFNRDFTECQFGSCRIGNYRDMALWLWRMHNAISMRVVLAHKEQVDRRWPMYQDCPSCWKEDVVLGKAGTTDAGPEGSTHWSVEELDAPFDTDHVFWHLVHSYVGTRRVSFQLQDLTDREQKVVKMLMEEEQHGHDDETEKTSSKPPPLHPPPKDRSSTRFAQRPREADHYLLHVLILILLAVGVACAVSHVLGLMKDRPQQSARMPIMRRAPQPEGDVAEDEERDNTGEPAAE